MLKKILIAYNFSHDEAHVRAPNFYKGFAQNISLEFPTKISFIPDPRKSILFHLLIFLRFSVSKASLITNSFWLTCNAYKFEVVVGWLGYSIIVGFLKSTFGWKHVNNYMVLYKIPSQANTNYLYFVKKFILKKALKGTTKLFAVDSSQAKFYEKELELKKGFVKTFRYGVDTKFYEKYIKRYKKSDDIRIFSPGGAHRDDQTLLSALRTLNVTLMRFHADTSGIISHKVEFLNNIRIEYFRNAPYSTYIKECCSCHFVVISVKNNEIPVGLTSLLECKALAKAVIITRGLSSIEYVNDQIDGLFFRQGNSKDLENKIRYLLRNPKIVKKIGIAAQKNVEREYSLSICARNFYSQMS
jgi:glycosyltransferase involved in cell wall biosynthesis